MPSLLKPPVLAQKSWLENSWYVVVVASELRAGKLLRRQIAGEAIVFGRAVNGNPFALKDRCPHRGAPLSAGELVDNGGESCVACPYHGWQFSTQSGACLTVPALSEKDDARLKAKSVQVERFPVQEMHGLLWVFIGDDEARSAVRDEHNFIPSVPLPQTTIAKGLGPKSVTVLEVAGPYVEAVTGLVDPAHTPFVHKQWWWREGRVAQEKQKHYEILPCGFRIPAHEPSSNSRIYKMLGGQPTTQIDFILPGVRIETVRLGEKVVVGLTVIVPIEENRNRIFHVLYWDIALLSWVKPVIDAMALSFLRQDARILSLQATNLLSSQTVNPPKNPTLPLFLGDPDMPAKWLHLLNRAWRERMNGKNPGPFQNPVDCKSLRWKT